KVSELNEAIKTAKDAEAAQKAKRIQDRKQKLNTLLAKVNEAEAKQYANEKYSDFKSAYDNLLSQVEGDSANQFDEEFSTLETKVSELNQAIQVGKDTEEKAIAKIIKDNITFSDTYYSNTFGSQLNESAIKSLRLNIVNGKENIANNSKTVYIELFKSNGINLDNKEIKFDNDNYYDQATSTLNRKVLVKNKEYLISTVMTNKEMPTNEEIFGNKGINLEFLGDKPITEFSQAEIEFSNFNKNNRDKIKIFNDEKLNNILLIKEYILNKPENDNTKIEFKVIATYKHLTKEMQKNVLFEFKKEFTNLKVEETTGPNEENNLVIKFNEVKKLLDSNGGEELLAALSENTITKFNNIMPKKGPNKGKVTLKYDRQKQILHYGESSSKAKNEITLTWRNPEGKPDINYLFRFMYNSEFGSNNTKVLHAEKDPASNRYFVQFKFLINESNPEESVQQAEAKKTSKTYKLFLS
ncbi:WXG100 family type VII secretion target, partial [Metamycoplasma neophronis]|uniref:WXG100 family type VII secretion target n=1 Tax=Metamycoplasma neophronis TaxID=872983 RepID=UPI001476B79B